MAEGRDSEPEFSVSRDAEGQTLSGNLNLKIIFGIKLKRIRESQGLTLSELSQKTQVSTSYLAEIEAGKKYPKVEKILQLAQALKCNYDDLISTKLDREFDGLQELLSSPGVRDFPFEMFGVVGADLIKLLSRSPSEVAALLRTIIDIARQYNIGVEHFLHAALRSYQELTDNYYEDIEKEAESFALAHLLDAERQIPIGQALRQWIQLYGEIPIDETTLGSLPSLSEFRAILCKKPQRLLLHPLLTESQKAFALAREVGYRALGLRARSRTAPPDREASFEQVLNDFKASYFAGALLLPRKRLVEDLRELFSQTTFQSAALLGLFQKHEVTAETLMYRISQLLPSHFGLRPHFLRFDQEGGRLRLVKQLNLSGLPMPPGTSGEEHQCVRWLATHLLRTLRKNPGPPVCGAQISEIVPTSGNEAGGGQGERFFCFGLALPMALRPHVHTSMTLGFREDETLAQTILFTQDPQIQRVRVGGTCERCPLSDGECGERVVPATKYQQQLHRKAQRWELSKLTGEGI